MGVIGSSPLTRGKRPRYANQAQRPRLIPAHAGKTEVLWLGRNGSAAHPRSRGENGYLSVFRVTGLGSSPLTRGKHWETQIDHWEQRLIPAHAGKTTISSSACRPTPAHPRSRGENAACMSSMVAPFGSSPLTRGKPSVGPAAGFGRGLIPAHAGKTGRGGPWWSRLSAHPRSRGENAAPDGFVDPDAGSSPLTRGKLCHECGNAYLSRLIPAHAGKTRGCRCRVSGDGAHPRSRGENCRRIARPVSGRGSSPLTRGKRFFLPSHLWMWGLIPAHAGKTTRLVSRSPPTTAHPRSRGENAAGRLTGEDREGSSPLTRGKLSSLPVSSLGVRLIPAHAGKTAWAHP